MCMGRKPILTLQVRVHDYIKMVTKVTQMNAFYTPVLVVLQNLVPETLTFNGSYKSMQPYKHVMKAGWIALLKCHLSFCFFFYKCIYNRVVRHPLPSVNFF